MIVFNTKAGLEEALDKVRANGQKIGLVPTMGALHAGHASLVIKWFHHTSGAEPVKFTAVSCATRVF